VSCHEACSNAMEHGYRFREAMIDVDAEFDGEYVQLTVADTGHWREQRDSDRGRGLELIRALMDEFELSPGDDGTVVRMRKRLAEPVAVPAANGRLGVADPAG
jgi:anti-sigma regulatory factor (Ser/Thr protein kinase)